MDTNNGGQMWWPVVPIPKREEYRDTSVNADGCQKEQTSRVGEENTSQNISQSKKETLFVPFRVATDANIAPPQKNEDTKVSYREIQNVAHERSPSNSEAKKPDDQSISHQT